MYELIREQYDSLYSAEKNVFGNGEPAPAVQKLPTYIKEGSVLDLGGGEGRNALYLAKQGFQVSVYDISKVGIERLKETATVQGLKIETRIVDITSEEIDGLFDAVVNTFVLHHINQVDALKLITDAQNHTKAGGVHVINTFSKQGDLYERNKKSSRFYPDKKTLGELYQEWNIEEISEYKITTHARHKNGDRMENQVLSLIAIKNKEPGNR